VYNRLQVRLGFLPPNHPQRQVLNRPLSLRVSQVALLLHFHQTNLLASRQVAHLLGQPASLLLFHPHNPVMFRPPNLHPSRQDFLPHFRVVIRLRNRRGIPLLPHLHNLPRSPQLAQVFVPARAPLLSLVTSRLGFLQRSQIPFRAHHRLRSLLDNLVVSLQEFPHANRLVCHLVSRRLSRVTSRLGFLQVSQVRFRAHHRLRSLLDNLVASLQEFPHANRLVCHLVSRRLSRVTSRLGFLQVSQVRFPVPCPLDSLAVNQVVLHRANQRLLLALLLMDPLLQPPLRNRPVSHPVFPLLNPATILQQFRPIVQLHNRLPSHLLPLQ
jgi:hypothetical protein